MRDEEITKAGWVDQPPLLPLPDRNARRLAIN